MPWKKPNYQRYFPSLTYQADAQLPTVLSELPAAGVGVDLGAGGRFLNERVLRMDFIPAGGTDLIADVQVLPLKDESVDLLIGTGLLEHVVDAEQVLSESFRTLKPGGVVHMEVPFLQQYHDDPIDLRRYTVDGLKRAIERHGFETVRSGHHIGPTTTLITLTAYYGNMLFEGRSKPMKALASGVFLGLSVAFWPLKFLDKWLIGRPSAHRLAFGVYCTARKPR